MVAKKALYTALMFGVVCLTGMQQTALATEGCDPCNLGCSGRTQQAIDAGAEVAAIHGSAAGLAATENYCAAGCCLGTQSPDTNLQYSCVWQTSDNVCGTATTPNS